MTQAQTDAEETPDAGIPPSGAATRRDRWRTFGAPALAAVTIVALCLGTLLGWVAFGAHNPSDDGADAGFARDMSEHHAQAVEMSFLVMQRTQDEAVDRLALDIANNQATERGMMGTWLRDWNLPFASPEGERMTWMQGHEGMDMSLDDLPPGVVMPGMASPTEIQELTDASDEQAEVLFLQLMTTHHLAGVEMADAALMSATQPEVLAAAQRMVNAQTGEITLMRDMLVERDAEPREDIDAWLAEQEAAEADDSGSGGHGNH